MEMFVKIHNIDKQVFVGPYDDKDAALFDIEESISSGKNIVLGESESEDVLSYEILIFKESREAGMKAEEYGDRGDNILSTVDAAVKYLSIGLDEVEEPTRKRGRPRVKREDVPSVEKSAAKRGRPKKDVTSLPVSSLEPLPKQKATTEEPDDLDEHEFVIVTDNMNVVELLMNNEFKGALFSRVRHPDEIMGKNTVGSALPLWLAKDANKVGIINITRLRQDQKAMIDKLTTDEMINAGAQIDWYRVKYVGTTKLRRKK